jgi:hypothetical protein
MKEKKKRVRGGCLASKTLRTVLINPLFLYTQKNSHFFANLYALRLIKIV